MAAETFPQAIEMVFHHEGGYVDDPRDPGGATSMGITIATLRDWRGKPVTKADVKALTRAEAVEIYRKNYWAPIQGDDLPAGLDYAVLDYAINSGPGRAARYLQKLVGVEQDGEIGPITVAAAAKATETAETLIATINAYCDARLAFLKDLDTWDTFGKGWERRVKEVRAHAMEIAFLDNSAKAPASPAQPPEPPPAPLGVEERLRALEARLDALEGR